MAEKQTEIAKAQTAEAIKQTKRTEAQKAATATLRTEPQVTESNLLAIKAASAFALPDRRGATDALLLALEGLPDATTNKARPLVAETHRQLDRAWRRFDTEAYTERQVFGHGGWVAAVAFAPDGQSVLTGSEEDRTARLWDRTGQELARFSHGYLVVAVAFAADGQSPLTGSADNTARLWDRTGKELARFSHEGTVVAVAFAPDGRSARPAPSAPSIVVTAAGKEARMRRTYLSAQGFVNAAKARAPRCLSQAQRKSYFLPLDRVGASQAPASRRSLTAPNGFRNGRITPMSGASG